jgi:uncharacterized cofD-like protein
MAARVVALGGGHGLAMALRAIRAYAGEVTGIVTVADDGGSSGRLRRDLDVPAPGDLRRCLVALAGTDGPWPNAFEHRFTSGELKGHALGNLILVGLYETLGDLGAAVDECGRMLGTVGNVIPATVGGVEMSAQVGAERVSGQVAVAHAGERDRIHDLRLDPPDPKAAPGAVEALAQAQQVVVAPGSLYTSIVAVMCVPQIRDAVAGSPAMVVQVANLATEHETRGHDGTDHLAAVHEHGGRVDVFLYDPEHGLAVDEKRVAALGARPVAAPISRADGSGHDPEQLAKALAALL